MIEPTDAELDELRQENSGRLNFVTLSEFRTIARAVLAKWGSQPVGAQPAPQQEAQEPVAWMRDWGVYDPSNSGPEFSHTKKKKSEGWVPLYTAPKPSPAPQGATTDEVDVPHQCPYFGPSPHRDVWLAGWYAARAALGSKPCA